MIAENEFVLVLVVLIFSIVQSIFGVGLLLFGTPSLMLLGFGFVETVALLLPCSIAIDLQQLCRGLPRSDGYVRKFLLLTLPFVCSGLFVTLYGIRSGNVAVFVGAMLIVLGLLRCSRYASERLQFLVRRHHMPYMALMGFIHGLTNMGGGLLVVLAGSYNSDKNEARSWIATGYVLFALTQIAMLVALSPTAFHLDRFYLVGISALTYFSANRLFHRLSSPQFQHLLTVLIISYGVLVIAK